MHASLRTEWLPMSHTAKCGGRSTLTIAETANDLLVRHPKARPPLLESSGIGSKTAEIMHASLRSKGLPMSHAANYSNTEEEVRPSRLLKQLTASCNNPKARPPLLESSGIGSKTTEIMDASLRTEWLPMSHAAKCGGKNTLMIAETANGLLVRHPKARPPLLESSGIGSKTAEIMDASLRSKGLSMSHAANYNAE
eukprot:284816628_6